MVAVCGCWSVFNAAADQILLHHQRHLEGDGVVELPQVQAGELLDLFQTVDQRIAVDKELPGSLGDVQVVLKELVDGVMDGKIDDFIKAYLMEFPTNDDEQQ